MFDFIRGTTKPKIEMPNHIRYCPECHRLRRWKRISNRFGYKNECCGIRSTYS